MLAIVALYAFIGWKRGFIHGAFDLVGWVGSIILSFLFYPYVSVTLYKMFPALGVWLNLVALLSTFLILRLVISFLFSLVTGSIPPRVQASPVNKFLGLVPGVLNGLISATIVALLLMALPGSDGLAAQTRSSKVADELTGPASWLENRVSPVLDSVINRTTTALTVEPGSNDYVQLPYTTTRVMVKPDLEKQMLQLVNEERAKKGQQPLQEDTALTAVGRAHLKDMFARGYFSHYTPEGKDPFYRMREAHIPFVAAGENLALAPTLHTAHSNLMHSPGHRANILNPAFKKVGIGVIESGTHSLMISQEFSN